MIAIITSRSDTASMNIRENLIDGHGFRKKGELYKKEDIIIYTFDDDSVYLENIDKDIEADLFIFATKHQSENGTHSLSCHTPGNWSKADFGGKDHKVCTAPSTYLKRAYVELLRYKDLGYEITMEQTHHGPYLKKPVMFIEIGSDEKCWQDKVAGNAIADVIMNMINKGPLGERSAIVLGGGHYNQAANKIMERTDIAVGHICAKFLLEDLTEDKLKKAIERSSPTAELLILDWKGLGQHKEHVKKLTSDTSIPVKRSQDILKK